MLDVTEALEFVRCMSVRFSQNTGREFLRRALQVVGHLRNGIPFFFNDDVMIPALEYKGIPHEDAVGYTDICCVETVIPGKSNPHAVSGRSNLAKAVEFALANGHSMMTPELYPGLPTGDAEQFTSYDEFKDAVYSQISHIIGSTCRQIASTVPQAAVNYPMPYKSLLTEGCMESGKDFNAGGPKYNYFQVCLIGIPNVADSLAAVRELVFRQGKYTMGDLLYQLEHDFPDEAVRLNFVNGAPKYGNDIDEVDNIAADVMNYACELLDKASEKYGYSFHAQPFSFLWMIEHGRTTAATPDGRRKGENLAYSLSPMQGRDHRGLTALFNTLTKLPTKRTPGTTSAIIEVDPTLFEDENLDIMTDIFRTAAEMGLSNAQFNMVDAETLKQAKAHPERHVNLEVRVSGFSQKFILLSPDLQDHIIARTKHAMI
jgi:formate C-acetyltransferase